MYGVYRRIIPIHLYTDSEVRLESIVSTKQVERKSLRMVIQDLKETLVDGEISSYQWIPTRWMWVDALMRQMEIYCDMRELLIEGNFELEYEGKNKVQFIQGEIKMFNIPNRDRENQYEDMNKNKI